jgi:uncharacterized protein with HEPN domain
MNEHDEIRLRDMLDAARRAQIFIAGKSRIDLEKDDFLIGFAVVRALEIIGEAASQITTATRNELSELAWREIIGMRNRIIHGYNRVNYDIVWDTVNKNISALIIQLQALLPPETDASETE